jgi:hydroxymethylglutaryl-CoA synthase
MHRPYLKMPVTAWALGYLFALGHDGGAGHQELAQYCRASQLELDAVLTEMRSAPDLSSRAARGELAAEAYPIANQLLKGFRESPVYQAVVDDKMHLGAAWMMETGNLYSASVLAWLFTGLAEALRTGADLAGRELLLVGYGSGDAAEVIPMVAMPQWQQAAARLNLDQAFAGAVDLNRIEYETLHDGVHDIALPPADPRGFVVERIGTLSDPQFTDLGIEYHRYAMTP